jgi:hypothetical protein
MCPISCMRNRILNFRREFVELEDIPNLDNPKAEL